MAKRIKLPESLQTEVFQGRSIVFDIEGTPWLIDVDSGVRQLKISVDNKKSAVHKRRGAGKWQ